MGKYPHIGYHEYHPQLPEAVRVATMEDLNRDRTELLGLRYYTKVNHHRKDCLACTINPFTKGLGSFISRGLLWLDEPAQVMTTDDPKMREYL